MNRQSGSSERIRVPAVAGRFYPGSAAELDEQVAALLGGAAADKAVDVAAIMVPHAGYVYSGATAGQVFARARLPKTAIILCPNHTGRGARIAVSDASAFSFPGGSLEVDRELADAIVHEIPGATFDSRAHELEHAIEVELPFLHKRRPDIRIVPVVLGHLDADEAINLGTRLHDIAGPDRAVVVASSDMSHYLPDEICRQQDSIALAPLLDGDARKLHETVTNNRISMCGFVPATVMLGYSSAAGAGRPTLVDYSTSGDAFGDRSQVVGYAGVLIPR